jgi:hypothetical protein
MLIGEILLLSAERVSGLRALQELQLQRLQRLQRLARGSCLCVRHLRVQRQNCASGLGSGFHGVDARLQQHRPR